MSKTAIDAATAGSEASLTGQLAATPVRSRTTRVGPSVEGARATTRAVGKGLLIRLEAKEGHEDDVRAFLESSGRRAYLSRRVAQALTEDMGELFDEPHIEQLGVVATKLPH